MRLTELLVKIDEKLQDNGEVDSAESAYELFADVAGLLQNKN